MKGKKKCNISFYHMFISIYWILFMKSIFDITLCKYVRTIYALFVFKYVVEHFNNTAVKIDGVGTGVMKFLKFENGKTIYDDEI